MTRVVVTGSTGRLGRAIVAAIEARPGWQAIPWTRADFDLDATSPTELRQGLERDAPDAVVHCAAWTDVDGCAREPNIAERRNGRATGLLAESTSRLGIGLVAVSTNEVFDGQRTDQRPYDVTDTPAPGNAYGRSKRLGEELAASAYATASAPLWIVRTAWLFGPPGADFPAKIARAARNAAGAGQALRLVADEFGSPTACADLASAIVDLTGSPGSAGIHHVVNAGVTSRAGWAREILRALRITVETIDVSIDEWPRPSSPPRWGALATTSLPTLGRLRSWLEAVRADLQTRSDLETPAIEAGDAPLAAAGQ